jgi:hypothetical protein
VVEVGTECAFLQSLDKTSPDGSYALLVSFDFGMRGVDYRAGTTGITLVVAQSFSNDREAIQALARVGRYDEPCNRYRVEGVELVDEEKKTEYIAGLLALTNLKSQVVAKA